MLLQDAIEGYLLFKSARVSPRTIETDKYVLSKFVDWYGNREVSEVTAEDIRAFFAHEEERGMAASSISRFRTSLSAFYTWLSDPEVGLVDHHPVRAVPGPKIPKLKPKALNQDEIEKLIDACENSKMPRRDKAIILFLLDTGCRASEMAGVRDCDIDFKRGRVKVIGKGSKERFVYLGRRALSALWLYVKEERPQHAKPGDDHLFLVQTGYPMNRDVLRQIFERRREEAGIHASPHMMRHSAAIARLRAGMDLISLQRMLGHETLETTKIYLTALADEDVEQAAKRTSPSDNWRL